jgi:hypothetical protein
VQPATENVASFTGTAAPRPRFTFAVALGATDASTCVALHAFFGVGSVTWWRRRKAHYDDEVTFAVRSTRALLETVVTFMDAHLPRSYKREQYEAWRARLLEHWELRAKRVRPCSVEGCDLPRRAHGLCRGHLFREHGT